MDEEDWEELDENAMDECMMLATQLCVQQDTHIDTRNHSAAPKNHSTAINGNIVSDSGVCSMRGRAQHHSAAKTNGAVNKNEGVGFRSRFSDFSGLSTNRSQSVSRKGVGSSGRSYGVCVKSPSKRSDVPGSHQGEAKKEEKSLNDKILVMQGEISLLRSELKRKDTALETERLDHCAALEAAEKRGREKVAKQATETEVKLKEKMTTLDKLQGELHFKNREVEELLRRCHQLEQQQQQEPQQSSRSPVGPPGKRLRLETKTFSKDADLTFDKRFDFGVSKSVEVQTKETRVKTSTRKRLSIPSPRGQICTTRRVATLLASNNNRTSQHKLSTTQVLPSTSMPPPPPPPPPLPPPSSSSSSSSFEWSLPSDWLSIISQALKEEDPSAEDRLVGIATQRLNQTLELIHTHSNNTQHTRSIVVSDGMEYYEGEVSPALHVISFFNSSSHLTTLHALITHLKPLYIKDVMVNRRIRHRILEATETMSRFLKDPVNRKDAESLVPSLEECCTSIRNSSEAEALLKAVAALSRRCKLCLGKDKCLVTPLCSMVKKLCVPSLSILQALLDLTFALVKLTSPSDWLTSQCPCSSQFLGTFVWHIYQTLDTATNEGNKSKVYSLLESCVNVLHYWSTHDTEWWEKVYLRPQYYALMIYITNKAKDINFTRETVKMVCTLHEFKEGTFDK